MAESETLNTNTTPRRRVQLIAERQRSWRSRRRSVGRSMPSDWDLFSTGAAPPGAAPGTADKPVDCVFTNEPDDDNDGLSNARELTENTDPNEPDSDGDTLLDGFEVHASQTDPTIPDSDGDGIPDNLEDLASLADVKFSKYNQFTECWKRTLEAKFTKNESGALENLRLKSIIDNRREYR